MAKPFEVCFFPLFIYILSYDIFSQGKETEHNWALRDQSIQRVRGMLKGEAHIRFPEPFFLGLKEGFIQWSLKTVASSHLSSEYNFTYDIL